MAGVEHAYQYSVEVKSRFSLFLDDNLNNEDPEVLISKLQQGRAKKEKASKNEVKTDTADAKPKQELKISEPKPVEQPPPVGQAIEPPNHDQVQQPHPPAFRGRGDAFHRGFRGRGRGGFPQNNVADATGDVQTQGNYQHEPRARGRGRGRPFRGRGNAYTDYREQYNQERGQPKAHQERGPQKIPQSEEKVPEQTWENADEVADATENVEQAADGPESPNKAEDVEEEHKTYTLEEYKAMRSSAKPVITLATKGSRKANDGKDVFKNMVEHRKINEVNEDKEDTSEHTTKEPPPEDKIEINFTFTDRLPDRERSGRGFNNRGFGRGRGAPAFRGGGRARGAPGPRGGFRGERGGRGFTRGAHHESPAAPVIYSDQDFPTLK